jgi:general stress protein CsbA
MSGCLLILAIALMVLANVKKYVTSKLLIGIDMLSQL